VTIRVLVADDQALVRGSFRILVDTAPDLTSVGEAASGAEAVELARSQKPDLVLMDIRMPGVDGIEATRQITADPQTSAVRVLILTTFDLDEYVFAALRAGASGFLLKDTPPADLLAAIRVVAAGDALLAPGVTRRLIAEFTRRPEPAQRPAVALEEVTEREREVLTLIGLGLSNTEIAAHLHVSLSTAKTHVGRLLMKLAARDRAQLVIAAYEGGLVGRLEQRRLPAVVDEQAVVAQPQAGGQAVLLQPAVVHEVAHFPAARRGDEIGQHPAVAPPPQALGAHHRRAPRAGQGE
jgi:DNA-binding NarL/FixJ family response regulator